MKKVFFAVGLITLLAAGCSSQTTVTTPVDDAPPTTSQLPAAVTPTEVPPQTQTTPNAASTNTNADLDASLKAVDTNMAGLNNDSVSIDSSLNEQQAPAK